MPPKNNVTSVSDACFSTLLDKLPPQEMFGAVFGLSVLSDAIWFWFKHIILCIVRADG